MAHNEFTDDLPEGTGIPGQKKEVTKATKKTSNPKETKEYAPSEKVLERLNKLPKEDIKKELGIDIDKMIKETKEYGILEALAYNQFTQKPLQLWLKVGHLNKKSFYATVNIWTQFDKDSKELKNWGFDYHPVTLKYKLDENGNRMKNELGNDILTYDRNEISMDEPFKLNGEMLSVEDKERLNVTGNLGRLMTVSFGDIPTACIISADPYNKHELCPIRCSDVQASLSNIETFQTYGENGAVYELSDKAKRDLISGKGVYLEAKENPDAKKVYVQFNAMTRRLERCQDYKLWKRDQVEAQQKAQTQTQSVEQTKVASRKL